VLEVSRTENKLDPVSPPVLVPPSNRCALLLSECARRLGIVRALLLLSEHCTSFGDFVRALLLSERGTSFGDCPSVAVVRAWHVVWGLSERCCCPSVARGLGIVRALLLSERGTSFGDCPSVAVVRAWHVVWGLTERCCCPSVCTSSGEFMRLSAGGHLLGKKVKVAHR